MNPGELRSRLIIQNLEVNNDGYSWSEISKLYCKKEIENKRSIFSKFGFATNETAKFTVRFNKNISKHNSILHDNKHYLITSIIDIDNKHAFNEITTVQITPKECEVRRLSIVKDKLNRPSEEMNVVFKFPGYVVEKYNNYDQEKPQVVIKKTYILVTPKNIKLELADLIVIEDVIYNVQIIHDLDEYINEYEITVEKDG